MKRRSLSPFENHRTSPLKNNPSKKVSSVYDRLGLKTSQKQETIPPKPEKISETIQTVDPVLEARRRKFEQKEITVKEGIIRLKPTKDDNVTKMDDNQMIVPNDELDQIEEIDEDALLEGDDTLLLDNQTDSILFSDEESNSDNEGRFKSKLENKDKVSILSFRKLINGTKNEVKNDLTVNKSGKRRNKKRNSSPSPQKNLSPRQEKITSPPAKKIKHSIVLPVDNKKIEIKLRNPAKYKKTESGKGNEENGRKIVEVFNDELVQNDATDASKNLKEAPDNLNEGKCIINCMVNFFCNIQGIYCKRRYRKFRSFRNKYFN